MKTCTMCHKTKPLNEFAIHPRGLNGRTSRCLECRRIEYKNWVKKVAKHGGLLMPTNIERFNNFIEKPDDPDACWIWKGSKIGMGYGRFNVNGKPINAHRYSYKIHIGEIPPKILVLHTCDNPSCCNPKHLFLGTHADNAIDMVKKKRQAYHAKNGRALLTEQQVLEIRKLSPIISRKNLAIEYNVSLSTIDQIIVRKTWRYI